MTKKVYIEEPYSKASDQLEGEEQSSVTEDLHCSVDVQLDVAHDWLGDLTFDLEHVDTWTTVTLIDRPDHPNSPFGCGGADINATIDDEGLDGNAETACNFANQPALSGHLVGGENRQQAQSSQES